MHLNEIRNPEERKAAQAELGRKLLHMMIGISAILLLVYNIITPWIIFGIFIACVVISLLSLRFRLPLVSFFLDNFERSKDKHQLPGKGIIFAMAGSLLVIRLFPIDIALASMVILTFADPVSYLVGKYLGKTPSILDERKNIEGNLAGFILSSLFAMFFVAPSLAIAGSLISIMLFESLIIEIQRVQLDDNLIIPLAAGTTMLILFKIFFI